MDDVADSNNNLHLTRESLQTRKRDESVSHQKVSLVSDERLVVFLFLELA